MSRCPAFFISMLKVLNRLQMGFITIDVSFNHTYVDFIVGCHMHQPVLILLHPTRVDESKPTAGTVKSLA